MKKKIYNLILIRETVILDRHLLHMDLDTAENMKSFAEDFTKLKGKEKEDVLMRYYSETAKAKTKAVTYEKIINFSKVFANRVPFLDPTSKD